MHSRFFKLAYASTLAIPLLIVCTACGNPSILIDPLINYRTGGRDPNESYKTDCTLFARWADMELRGEKPHGFSTWKEFWRDIYRRLREDRTHPEEIPRIIDCAHETLLCAGLPTYDP